MQRRHVDYPEALRLHQLINLSMTAMNEFVVGSKTLSDIKIDFSISPWKIFEIGSDDGAWNAWNIAQQIMQSGGEFLNVKHKLCDILTKVGVWVDEILAVWTINWKSFPCHYEEKKSNCRGSESIDWTFPASRNFICEWCWLMLGVVRDEVWRRRRMKIVK